MAEEVEWVENPRNSRLWRPDELIRELESAAEPFRIASLLLRMAAFAGSRGAVQLVKGDSRGVEDLSLALDLGARGAALEVFAFENFGSRSNRPFAPTCGYAIQAAAMNRPGWRRQVESALSCAETGRLGDVHDYDRVVLNCLVDNASGLTGVARFGALVGNWDRLVFDLCEYQLEEVDTVRVNAEFFTGGHFRLLPVAGIALCRRFGVQCNRCRSCTDAAGSA